MPIGTEPIETQDLTVKCDGGGLPLGHPLIYLNLGAEGKIICPYCSQLFIRNQNQPKDKGKRNAPQN